MSSETPSTAMRSLFGYCLETFSNRIALPEERPASPVCDAERRPNPLID
jgi:hypothetical protein